MYDGYNSTLSGSGMSATQTTVPVSSLSIGSTGVTITPASTTFPVYLTISPNTPSIKEIVECNAISGNSFTNCFRQIAPVCNNSTSTIQAITGTSGAFPHAAGEPVIMSNNACFFNRFVDVNTAQSVTGTKTFVANGGNIRVGDNTTGTAKYVYFPNGQTNSPYFKVVGPAVGYSTSSFFFSVDGISDLQLNASGTTVGVSPTGGISLSAGLLAINTSSTAAAAIDSTNKLFVAASSTASTNGGFIKYAADALGSLYWDVASFLNGAWTWAGNQIFSGTVVFRGNATSTAVFAVQAPTSTMDAVNKGYSDNSVTFFAATGTAGMPLVAGNALFYFVNLVYLPNGYKRCYVYV